MNVDFPSFKKRERVKTVALLIALFVFMAGGCYLILKIPPSVDSQTPGILGLCVLGFIGAAIGTLFWLCIFLPVCQMISDVYHKKLF